MESLINTPRAFVWGILILGILAIVVLSFNSYYSDIIRKLGLIFGFCFLFLTLGIVRVQISEFNIANDKLSKLNGKGQVVLSGFIADEPDLRETSQKLKIKVGKSTILATTKRYPEYKYLDTVKITGKLETPFETDEFSYKNYLMKDHIYSVISFPEVKVLPEKRRQTVFSYLYEKILFSKQKLRESIQRNFLPPHSSILEGTVLGDNGAMTNDLKNKLNITGLRHIIAVSGTHIVILSSIVMSLLLYAGFHRGRAFYIAIIFICIYIILTGLPSSGIRAGIMGGLYLVAQKLGRQNTGSRTIVMACAAMLVINPLLLIYDIGFQLSFLAVMGLIYLEPLIKSLIKSDIVSATFAAQIFTLPLMIYNFGNVSFVSPIANLLILPIVPFLMGLGFLASIAGIFSDAIGWLLSVPCGLLLDYFSKVIDIFSQLWMARNFENISWIWLFIFYFLITAVTWLLNKKFSQKFV